MQKICVLLPFHRDDELLQSAVNSIFDSREIDPDLLLIDDRKTKNELNLRVPHGLSYRLIENTLNHGYGNALRMSFNNLEHDYVALMNSDDLISPYRFIKQIKSLNNADLSITKMRRMSNGRIYRSLTGSTNFNQYTTDFLIFGAYGADATWTMRRNWWEKQTLDNRECLDWRIALKSFQSTKIAFVDEELYFYRKHSKQLNYAKMSQEDLHAIYTDWNCFLMKKNFPSASLEVFKFFAMPWMRSPIRNIEEILEWSEKYILHAENFDKITKNIFLKFLRRRFAVGITIPELTVGERLKMIIHAKDQAIGLAINHGQNQVNNLQRYGKM